MVATRVDALGLTPPPMPAAVIDDAMLTQVAACLLYTSDAADERSSVDLGGRRILKKKTQVMVKSDMLS